MQFSPLLLVSNDKTIRENHDVYYANLNIYDASIIDNFSHEADKLIHTFSDYVLTESDKSLQIKGLKFAVLPTKMDCSNFLLSF